MGRVWLCRHMSDGLDPGPVRRALLHQSARARRLAITLPAALILRQFSQIYSHKILCILLSLV